MKTTGLKRIAERYVRALFEVAKAANELDAIEADLNSLGDALAENDEFRQFLRNPLLTPDQQIEVMQAILTKMKAHKLTQQFIALLANHKRLPILAEAVVQFSELAGRERGEINAQLIVASALKPLEVTLVAERLSKAYGKKVKLDVRQDPELLGGVVVKIGSTELDGSLAGKMRRLKLALQAA